jgi:thiol:disulfide interchange protein DsbD
VSGYLPPNSYREWKDPKSTECPQNLSCFHDLKEALCYAKSQGKPVFIDFTGYACVNCRKMEDKVWSDPEVYRRLNEKYVVVSLYVDDKKALPAEQQYETKDGYPIRTIGNKWSLIEREYYKRNSQPWYVLVDNEGKLLTPPQGYTENPPDYVDYLDKGLKKFEERKK